MRSLVPGFSLVTSATRQRYLLSSLLFVKEGLVSEIVTVGDRLPHYSFSSQFNVLKGDSCIAGLGCCFPVSQKLLSLPCGAVWDRSEPQLDTADGHLIP